MQQHGVDAQQYGVFPIPWLGRRVDDGAGCGGTGVAARVWQHGCGGTVWHGRGPAPSPLILMHIYTLFDFDISL